MVQVFVQTVYIILELMQIKRLLQWLAGPGPGHDDIRRHFLRVKAIYSVNLYNLNANLYNIASYTIPRISPSPPLSVV